MARGGARARAYLVCAAVMRTRGDLIGARRYQSTLGRDRTEVASDALTRATLGQVRTRSAALLLSILVRPVLKHGPRSLTCARVIGLCET